MRRLNPVPWLLGLAACSASVPLPDLPTQELALRRCQLGAVLTLPDPEKVSLDDLRAAQAAVKACSATDAGAP
jgi:hypothetical protein